MCTVVTVRHQMTLGLAHTTNAKSLSPVTCHIAFSVRTAPSQSYYDCLHVTHRAKTPV